MSKFDERTERRRSDELKNNYFFNSAKVLKMGSEKKSKMTKSLAGRQAGRQACFKVSGINLELIDRSIDTSNRANGPLIPSRGQRMRAKCSA